MRDTSLNVKLPVSVLLDWQPFGLIFLKRSTARMDSHTHYDTFRPTSAWIARYLASHNPDIKSTGRLRTICVRWTSAWRRPDGALWIDRHGDYSWMRLRPCDTLQRERGRRAWPWTRIVKQRCRRHLRALRSLCSAWDNRPSVSFSISPCCESLVVPA